MPQNDEEITRETWSDDCQSTADVIRLERHSRPFQRFVSLCRTPFYSVFIHFFFSVVSVPKRNQHEKNGISNVHRKKKNQRWKRVPFQMEIGSMRCSFFFFGENSSFQCAHFEGSLKNWCSFFVFVGFRSGFFFVSRDGKSFSLSATRSGAPNSQRRQRRSLPACRHSLASKNWNRKRKRQKKKRPHSLFLFFIGNQQQQQQQQNNQP